MNGVKRLVKSVSKKLLPRRYSGIAPPLVEGGCYNNNNIITHINKNVKLVEIVEDNSTKSKDNHDAGTNQNDLNEDIDCDAIFEDRNVLPRTDYEGDSIALPAQEETFTDLQRLLDVDDMLLIYKKHCCLYGETSGTQFGCRPGLQPASISGTSYELTGEIVKFYQKVTTHPNFHPKKKRVKTIKRDSIEIISHCASKKIKKLTRNSEQEPIIKVLRNKVVGSQTFCIVCRQSLRSNSYRSQLGNNVCRKCKVFK